MFPSSDEASGNEGNKCGGGCYAPIEPSGKNETDAAKSGSYPDPDNEQRAPPGISHGVSGFRRCQRKAPRCLTWCGRQAGLVAGIQQRGRVRSAECDGAAEWLLEN
jgi:hypothetical protein